MKITRDTQTMARRLLRLCLVNNVLDEARVRRVSEVITSGKWRNKLPLLMAFTKLVKIELGKREATIQSAVELTDAERQQIMQKLEAQYGGALTYIWQVEPSLIAGIRVKVADDVTDGSVKMRIAKLEQIAAR